MDSSLVPSEPVLQQFMTNTVNSAMKTLSTVKTYLADSAKRLMSYLPTLQATNNSVMPLNDVQANSKWLYSVLINNLISGSATYSVAQLNDLRALAVKCPYSDGYAVYQARAILTQYDTVEYINPCEVVLPEVQRSMSVVKDKEITEFQLFPNPNTGNMNFIYTMSQQSKGEFIIYDLAESSSVNIH